MLTSSSFSAVSRIPIAPDPVFSDPVSCFPTDGIPFKDTAHPETSVPAGSSCSKSSLSKSSSSLSRAATFFASFGPEFSDSGISISSAHWLIASQSTSSSSSVSGSISRYPQASSKSSRFRSTCVSASRYLCRRSFALFMTSSHAEISCPRVSAAVSSSTVLNPDSSFSFSSRLISCSNCSTSFGKSWNSFFNFLALLFSADALSSDAALLNRFLQVSISSKEFSTSRAAFSSLRTARPDFLQESYRFRKSPAFFTCSASFKSPLPDAKSSGTRYFM